jgi:hypothetical protein
LLRSRRGAHFQIPASWCYSGATNELLRNQGAEDLIRAMMIESTAPALDRALFSADPATAERPAGILNGIAALPPSANLIDDLIRLITGVAPVSGNGQLAFVAAPDVAAAINLLPRALAYPVLVSATLPPGTIIAG